MCGIALALSEQHGLDAHVMGAGIHRRGITSTVTSIGNGSVYFTHLPITTSAFDQPAKYGHITLWLNGFISNWKELSDEVGKSFGSDTQLLAYWVNNGLPLDRLNGFFAVVYHSSITGKFDWFTDRYGIKQLYQYGNFICSEVKGLKAVVDLKIDLDAMADWDHSLGVMTPDTIYVGVKRVGQLPFVRPEKITISYEDAKHKLTEIWERVVWRNRYEGAGCYLSGGIDSGMIAKWFNPDYCFSMDYLNASSEIEGIKTNTTGNHYTMICNDAMAERYSNEVMKALDDPKVGSCYTNFALAELASKFCKVVYSGAGGDEVFKGYTHRYDKDIQAVINRTGAYGKRYDITHDAYDWAYLRGILVVEDRMGGWHTMETRYPFLDNELVDFALSLPDKYLFGKRILKDISGLPDEILVAKKRGFSNPHFTNKEWTHHVKSRLV
jgi:asparagine synthase (glutamine-hydrolysing)